MMKIYQYFWIKSFSDLEEIGKIALVIMYGLLFYALAHILLEVYHLSIHAYSKILWLKNFVTFVQ